MNSFKKVLLATAMVAGFASQADAAAMYSQFTGWSTAVIFSGQTASEGTSANDYTSTSSISGLVFNSTLTGISPTVEHRTVGSSWGTWQGQPGSNGQTVWFSNSATSVSATFNAGTFLSNKVTAFGFYIEPDPFSVYNISLDLSDGSTLTQAVSGSGGASFFGWVGDGVTGFTIDGGGAAFAFGDFFEGFAKATSVPEPFTLSLFGAGLVGAAALRRKKAKSA